MKRRILYIVVCVFCLILVGCNSQNHAGAGSIADKVQKDAAAEPEAEPELEPEAEEPEEDILEITVEEPTSAAQNTEPEKKGILIALDPGHQSPAVDMSALEPNAPGSSTMKAKCTGGTSGTYSGIPEYQLALEISLMVRDALVEQGYDVIMTRENNETAISNAERATLANDSGADISVRIHANGSEDASASGALVLIGSAGNPYVGHLYNQSYTLADCVLNSYCEATGMRNQGIQTNDTMTGINWSQVPVIILEMGFMTNQQDDLNMADPNYREAMVDGIVNGINAYYMN